MGYAASDWNYRLPMDAIARRYDLRDRIGEPSKNCPVGAVLVRRKLAARRRLTHGKPTEHP